MSIAIGKISVAFLLERIICPSSGAVSKSGLARSTSRSRNYDHAKKKGRLKGIDWRRAILRGISGSVALSAIVTVILFYVQCRPAAALWDHRLLPPNGTAKCWNPIPVNTWDLVIASYWSFLDFILALIPLPLVLSLRLPLSRKLLLSLLLSMGIFAGIAAAIKTSKVPISVKGKRDITWQTVELLLWNGIEMNVIIVAACIPTLRPVFLVLFRRSEARDFADDNLNDRGGLEKGAARANPQIRAQSYYFGSIGERKRRRSIPLQSEDDTATFHSAKSSSSPTRRYQLEDQEEQLQHQRRQQRELELQYRQRSVSDSDTTLTTQMISPSSLPKNIHISTREIIEMNIRDSLHPQPLKISKSPPLPSLPIATTPERAAVNPSHEETHGQDSSYFTPSSPSPSPSSYTIHPPGGNSWRQPFPRSMASFPPPPPPTTTTTSSDPDAITEAPPPPPPAYHQSQQPPLPPQTPLTPTTGRKRGLSAPLSAIGRPSPPISAHSNGSLRGRGGGTGDGWDGRDGRG